jgi:uncharacterized phage protein (TIGR01671 family)
MKGGFGMQDRYLFRGKRIDNGEWVLGHYVALRENRHAIATLLHNYGNQLGFDDVDLATVGNCTGLRDKNEVLIFEGDIVEIQFEEIDGSVVFAIETIAWRDCGWVSLDGDSYDVMDGTDCHNMKIIGNIHDNPDLLEVKLEEAGVRV